MTERMTPEQVPDDLVTRALQARDQAANVVYGDERQMRHVLAAVLSEVRAAERVEYACRWTDWDNRSGELKTRIQIEVGGHGDEGRMHAEHYATQTRQWQPHHGLPADAVVVFRPVSEWAVLADGEG